MILVFNPNEHLWDELYRRIPTSRRRKNPLFAEKNYKTYTFKNFKNLVESVPKRLKKVLQKKGKHTKY